MDKETLYERTGIGMMQFNSLFQLYSMVKNRSILIDAAHTLLFIPDLFNYLFAGNKTTEFSFATTSQLFNPKKNQWEESIFNVMGLSSALMNDIILPGTYLGTLTDPIKKQTGSSDIKVPKASSHIVRIILESLALKYRQTLDQLRQVTQQPIETIHSTCTMLMRQKFSGRMPGTFLEHKIQKVPISEHVPHSVLYMEIQNNP